MQPFNVTIARRACELFDLPPGSIMHRSRLRPTVRARQAAMYVARMARGLSYPEIGHFFGFDHTTVMHAVECVEGLIQKDPDFAVRVLTLMNEGKDLIAENRGKARAYVISNAKALPVRITTRQVCLLAGYGDAKLSKKIAAGEMPAPVDRGKENLFDRDAVLRALGMVDSIPTVEETAQW